MKAISSIAISYSDMHFHCRFSYKKIKMRKSCATDGKTQAKFISSFHSGVLVFLATCVLP